jgi:3-oxoacyl-[acyl-carrier-protein] synthase III
LIFRTSNQAMFCLSLRTDCLKENSLLPSKLPSDFRSPHCTRVKISALGTYVPPKVLTNADLEKMVETNDQWITERTGIKERHILEKGQGTSDMAAEAARRCLAARGIEASEVEAIVVGTVTPDMMFPSTACLVQDKIGAKGAWGFDVSAGCCGFVFALQAGAKLVESGAHKKVLVIGGDANSRIVDYTDRTTCIIFGDGAGAVLIEPAEEGEIGLIDFVHEVDGSCGPALNLAGGGSLNPASAETLASGMHFIHQDGQTVYKFAVRKMAEATSKVLERNDVTGKDLGCFIPHQANKRIIESTAHRLGMPMESVIINIDRYGNTTAATIPLAMQTALDDGRLKKGDLVLLASVGAGFTIGATLLRWEL